MRKRLGGDPRDGDDARERRRSIRTRNRQTLTVRVHDEPAAQSLNCIRQRRIVGAKGFPCVRKRDDTAADSLAGSA
jgi:hypothetical protein